MTVYRGARNLQGLQILLLFRHDIQYSINMINAEKKACINSVECVIMSGIERNLPLLFFNGGEKAAPWGDVKHAVFWEKIFYKYADF